MGLGHDEVGRRRERRRRYVEGLRRRARPALALPRLDRVDGGARLGRAEGQPLAAADGGGLMDGARTHDAARRGLAGDAALRARRPAVRGRAVPLRRGGAAGRAALPRLAGLAGRRHPLLDADPPHGHHQPTSTASSPGPATWPTSTTTARCWRCGSRSWRPARPGRRTRRRARATSSRTSASWASWATRSPSRSAFHLYRTRLNSEVEQLGRAAPRRAAARRDGDGFRLARRHLFLDQTVIPTTNMSTMF